MTLMAGRITSNLPLFSRYLSSLVTVVRTAKEMASDCFFALG